ncbi:TetR family transcriptional regulator [Tetragenococcus halophilus subsp. flandriensis]|uniref:TetR/AcrR family transcriptional regulator n=1 Tax=Tetragenococcus halophilus TaxID=51669 RepID=UPI0023E93C4A|nr:TetR/AcrR family transcriptional regulator [Tetragenococcus halophilus]GMA07006.1 TetR family transcriptional regulator [Tetragenococcus halophilus subsp. flandriensis]
MTTAFSKDEKVFIEEKLHEVARKCLFKYGVQKTTVEQITKMAGISKGSFYSFYPSKEMLFFVVLEEYQKNMMTGLVDHLKKEDYINVEKFTQLLYNSYKNIRYSFVMTILQNQEIELLMRKLPKDMITHHHSFDETVIEGVLSHVKLKKGISGDLVSASLRAIFMSMLHTEAIGEKQFDEVLEVLIKGLAQQIIEED